MPFVTAPDGVHIHYQVEGDGPPLALLHGNGSSGDTWRERGYVERLAKEFKLILLDQRGYGRSDKPTSLDAYEYRNLIADVVAVLDALSISTAHLFGYSMGGATTMNAAIYAPDRFRSLTIGGHSPNGAVDSVALSRTWEQAWELLSNRPYADHDAWKACFLVCQKFGGGVEALKTTTLPFLLFAGEDDTGPFEADRRFAEEQHTPFFSLPGKDHGGAILAVDDVAPRVLEFIRKVESETRG